jgi:hypothetical protein
MYSEEEENTNLIILRKPKIWDYNRENLDADVSFRLQ